jgi:pimeloyl-ACP methyl ester carboxylesterase
MPRAIFLLAALAVGLASGCAATTPNPSFAVTVDQASQAIQTMQRNARPLPRPVVVVGGFMDPNVTTPFFARFFESIAGDTPVISVSIGTCGSFDECRARVIEAVDRACPSDDPQWTAEVDVVGLSLGGLTARYAAAPSRDPNKPRRLKIARLFTISSPHTGAALADRIALTDFHRDMRAGSPFLHYVAEHDREANYELYTYVHLDDDIVGEQYAAPAGTNPWWLPNPPGLSAHLQAMMDERILADIARRLRGEAPFTQTPACPIPKPL